MDPRPVCSESLNSDPVNIRLDPKPWRVHDYTVDSASSLPTDPEYSSTPFGLTKMPEPTMIPTIILKNIKQSTQPAIQCSYSCVKRTFTLSNRPSDMKGSAMAA